MQNLIITENLALIALQPKFDDPPWLHCCHGNIVAMDACLCKTVSVYKVSKI